MSKSKRAVFFDRDGLLIKDVAWISAQDQIKPLPGAFEAVKKIKKAGFLTIVVSNQSAVARGLITFSRMKQIDKAFRLIFKKSGAEIDQAYYCPHHPDFTGECGCRKPKTGMFDRAKHELQIDAKSSFVIGDKNVDIEAGKRAGCLTGVLVKRNQKEWDLTTSAKDYADFRVGNVLSAVNWILSQSV